MSESMKPGPSGIPAKGNKFFVRHNPSTGKYDVMNPAGTDVAQGGFDTMEKAIKYAEQRNANNK